MSRELLAVVEAVSNEKDIPREAVFEVLESALSAAIRKKLEREVEVRVSIDRRSGTYSAFRRWLVVEQVSHPTREITLEAARFCDPLARLGGYVEDEIDSMIFDRITTQTARQIIVQRVREAERAAMLGRFRHLENRMITGVVKQVGRKALILELGGGAEGMIERDGLLPRENFRVGDRVSGILHPVQDGRGSRLLVSRSGPGMLGELLRLEVPEIAGGMIEIRAIARDPGSRAKVAVRTDDRSIDPVGACVGVRGTRIQSISSALGGERVDVVRWDADPVRFVVNAVSPVDVRSVVVDEDARTMDVVVEGEMLSQVAGRGDQNVRLISRLLGDWQIGVLSVEELQERRRAEVELLARRLDVGSELVSRLVKIGVSSPEELVYLPADELSRSGDLSADEVELLRGRARDLLAGAPGGGPVRAALDGVLSSGGGRLLDLPLIGEDLALRLAERGILTLEMLAEQGVDDLSGIEGLSDEEAGRLIMAARDVRWFGGLQGSGSDRRG